MTARSKVKFYVRSPGFESQRGTWMFVCCECCVLSGRDLCVGLITRPGESYRLRRVCVWSRNLKNRKVMVRVVPHRLLSAFLTISSCLQLLFRNFSRFATHSKDLFRVAVLMLCTEMKQKTCDSVSKHNCTAGRWSPTVYKFHNSWLRPSVTNVKLNKINDRKF